MTETAQTTPQRSVSKKDAAMTVPVDLKAECLNKSLAAASEAQVAVLYALEATNAALAADKVEFKGVAGKTAAEAQEAAKEAERSAAAAWAFYIEAKELLSKVHAQRLSEAERFSEAESKKGRFGQKKALEPEDSFALAISNEDDEEALSKWGVRHLGASH